MNAALGGREIALADAPDPRSPVHRRAGALEGRTFERAEARGKHLLAHFSEDLVVHSHLGMNGRWFVSPDGRRPHGRPWLVLVSGPAIASQLAGKLLRIVSESRARNDPALMQLGPDPLPKGLRRGGRRRAPARRRSRTRGRRRPARPAADRRDRQCDSQRGVLPGGHRSMAEGRRSGGAGGREAGRGEPAGDAGIPAPGAPPAQHLQGRVARLPPLRHPDPLTGTGRCQPHRLLVPSLPGLNCRGAPLSPRVPNRGRCRRSPGRTGCRRSDAARLPRPRAASPRCRRARRSSRARRRRRR